MAELSDKQMARYPLQICALTKVIDNGELRDMPHCARSARNVPQGQVSLCHPECGFITGTHW